MTDIVERLRDWAAQMRVGEINMTAAHLVPHDLLEAADEIERLRALTAAAEVDGRFHYGSIEPAAAVMESEETRVERLRFNAIIERCAQVAETVGDHSSRALTIAAAIRALD